MICSDGVTLYTQDGVRNFKIVFILTWKLCSCYFWKQKSCLKWVFHNIRANPTQKLVFLYIAFEHSCQTPVHISRPVGAEWRLLRAFFVCTRRGCTTALVSAENRMDRFLRQFSSSSLGVSVRPKSAKFSLEALCFLENKTLSSIGIV